MKKYKTKKISTSGCDLIILEHLQRRESVFCKDGNGAEGYIEQYVKKGLVAYYICDNGRVLHADAKPVPMQLRVKKASEIIKWLEDNGYTYTPDHGGSYCVNLAPPVTAGYRVAYIHQIAGQAVENTEIAINPEWIEYVEEEAE